MITYHGHQNIKKLGHHYNTDNNVNTHTRGLAVYS